MAFDRQKVIDVAKAEVGYMEKSSNAQLDDPIANAGNKNWTKYARDIDNISGYFNGKKNGYEWCASFVNWCFIKAYGVDTAKKLLCLPDRALAASCTYAARYFQQVGRFFGSDPQPGDQIFFGTEGNVYHTGIVVSVDVSYVYTVEGNTMSGTAIVSNGGMVCSKKYLKRNSGIYGYGRPNYADDYTITPQKRAETIQSASGVKKRNPCNVVLYELEKGHTGYSVKVMQNALIHHSCSVGIDGADGDFGANTLSALLKFQKENGLDADGICGSKTWAKLIND